MLTSLRIKNFKSWADTDNVRLAPLTVIFGANSAGKSSLGHLLLALKQTALSSDRKRALNLGDANSMIDLGTFADCLHGHDIEKTLEFDLAWRLPKQMVIKNPIEPFGQFTGDTLALHAELSVDHKTSQPKTTGLRYTLSTGQQASLDISVAMDEKGKFDLVSDQLKLVRAQGRPWPMEDPEKFYRLSEVSIARHQNAGFLTDFALATEAVLRTISYLGPLREPPQRIYLWSGDTPEDVGQKGQFAIAALLAAQDARRSLNRKKEGKGGRKEPFAEFIAAWLVNLGIISRFIVKSVAPGRKEYEVLIKTDMKAPEVKISDVGFGISQVLPALVQAFYCPPNSTVWMEQPEIHLHPRVQAELADVFISAIQTRENGSPRNTQLIVESHSEHFLNRLQRRVAEETISKDDVAIYFAKRAGGKTELEPLRLNQYGDIENWPEDFFGDEMADLTARTVAAAQRRQREHSK
jgi:predicted ATPase